MEQNREPRKKSMYMWSIDLDRVLRIHKGERIVSSANGIGKTGYPRAKE